MLLGASGTSTSAFWGVDLGWDSCHEVSASTGEGVEEVFRVITRRLVEQRNARAALEAQSAATLASGVDGRGTPGSRSEGGEGYFHDDAGGPYGGGAGGSFRVGVGDKRRSWLGLPQFQGVTEGDGTDAGDQPRRRGPCCT
jgi:hypothetical protein